MSTKAGHCAWSCPRLTEGVGRTGNWCRAELAREFTSCLPGKAQAFTGSRQRRDDRRRLELLQSGDPGRAGLVASLRLQHPDDPWSAGARLPAAARFELRLRRRSQLRLRRAVDLRRRSLAAGVRVAERLRVRRLLTVTRHGVRHYPRTEYATSPHAPPLRVRLIRRRLFLYHALFLFVSSSKNFTLLARNYQCLLINCLLRC